METYWEKLAYSRQELSTCEAEPIQFCGAIQNFGWVLVCDEASGQIVAASENCEQLFAQPLSTILGRNAGDFLNFRDGGRFLPKSMVHRDEFVSEGIFVTSSQKLLWESYARFQDLVIIDLELMEAESATESASVLDRLKSLVRLMDQQGDGENGLNIAAKKMKTMTGFDRVMIYRFEQNGDGYVVADKKCSYIC
jgi:light-regulated signal transduction histidine kinase (bacteriophytochrome)